MNEIHFEAVKEEDLEKILCIYNHYILTTTINFYFDEISIDTLKSFIYLDHSRYKSFLISHKGEFAGFCFLTQYRDREAYDGTAELAVYLKPGFTRRGLGAEAVRHLEKVAAERGIKTVIASISGENTESLNLFRKLQYDKCGHFKKIGEKFGRELDVVYFQKSLVT